MASNFLHLATTPSVAEAQRRYLGRAAASVPRTGADRLGDDERNFIEARDSFYLSSMTETGWPYIQHRGGPAGFLRVLAENVIALADVRGNRQLLSTGNVAANDRVALFLMDYPQRSRLKILGHARVIAANDDSELATRLSVNGVGPVERLFTVEVVAFDWNCPKYITPRYTRAEVEEFAAPLRNRITELESKLSAIEAQKRELHS